MADATIVDGSEIVGHLNGLTLHAVQISTGTNGEDGVTFQPKVGRIRSVMVTSNEDGKTGEFTASWSGGIVTVKSILGTPGDEATVSVLVLGS